MRKAPKEKVSLSAHRFAAIVTEGNHLSLLVVIIDACLAEMQASLLAAFAAGVKRESAAASSDPFGRSCSACPGNIRPMFSEEPAASR